MTSSRTIRFVVAAVSMLGVGLVFSQGCAVLGDYEFEKDYQRAPDDLGAAGTSGTGGGCKPYTCAQFKAECGQIDDGCGATVFCGL